MGGSPQRTTSAAGTPANDRFIGDLQDPISGILAVLRARLRDYPGAVLVVPSHGPIPLDGSTAASVTRACRKVYLRWAEELN